MEESLDVPDGIEIWAPGLQMRRLTVGDSLVFGRGQAVDLRLEGDRWMSRRAGRIEGLSAGALIVNLSEKQALLVRTRSGEVRLPAAIPGDAGSGHLVRAGTALVGSATMLDQRAALRVSLPPVAGTPENSPMGGTSTEARVRLNQETRGFMVTLLLCRRWLLEPSRIDPLPTIPELARQALEETHALHLIKLIEQDTESRKRLERKVHDHVKHLQGKLADHRLVARDGSVGKSAIVSALLHFDVLDRRHLDLFDDEHWLSVQENAWWNCM